MSVQIKCFASLRQKLALGDDGVEVPHRAAMTIADLWQAITDQTPPDNLLCARNHEYADLQTAVDDGDEVAFFPPVTGG